MKNLTLQKWRSKVAYLPQDIFIVDKTLKENIALGIEKNNIEKSIFAPITKPKLVKKEVIPKGTDSGYKPKNAKTFW